MDSKRYELYLDESGDFEDRDLRKGWTPSFVGGILCPSEVISQDKIDELIKKPIHAMEAYDKEQFLGIIESLLLMGGRIVLFENNERVRILDGDTTYLNIITEGLTKLLRDLHNENPEANIEINILIATRQNSEEREKGNLIRIMEKEYLRRFEESMYASLGRNKIDHVSFSISFANAKRDKRLMFADIICNTWLTRKAKIKFNAEDRARIASLYADSVHYEVYEDPDAGYIRRLISENRIGEAIAQLCTHSKIKRAVLDVRDILLDRILNEYPRDREIYFQYMSLKIGQFNRRRDYLAGIQFAKQYKELVLTPLFETKEVRNSAEYWTFDTDFYLLTMYDHIGNADMCTEYANRCNEHIDVVSHSWEHMDYYFNFRIRELNRMIGRFEFENVIAKTQPLIEALQAAKKLFSTISPKSDSDQVQKSDLLGKVYGIRLEAYTNLLYDHPEYFRQALDTSNLALEEFTKAFDLHRQYQYRCLMFTTAGKEREALDSLLNAYDMTLSDGVFSQFIEKTFSVGTKADVFALFHYTNVMLLLKQKEDPLADQMFRGITAHPRFVNETKKITEDDYPWNLIFWNLGRYYRYVENESETAKRYITKAILLTTKHKKEKTMFSFAVCMAAEQLIWAKNNESVSVDEMRGGFDKIYCQFKGMELPEAMMHWFSFCQTEDMDKELRKLANHTLK